MADDTRAALQAVDGALQRYIDKETEKTCVALAKIFIGVVVFLLSIFGAGLALGAWLWGM